MLDGVADTGQIGLILRESEGQGRRRNQEHPKSGLGSEKRAQHHIASWKSMAVTAEQRPLGSVVGGVFETAFSRCGELGGRLQVVKEWVERK